MEKILAYIWTFEHPFFTDPIVWGVFIILWIWMAYKKSLPDSWTDWFFFICFCGIFIGVGRLLLPQLFCMYMAIWLMDRYEVKYEYKYDTNNLGLKHQKMEKEALNHERENGTKNGTCK